MLNWRTLNLRSNIYMKVPKRIGGRMSPSHIRSPKQESSLAKRMGGKVTKGSGNGNEKGDVRLRGVCRIEAKTTKNKSFSVTREMIEKIEEAAITSGELPAFVVEFIDTNGNAEMEVAVVPTYVLDIIRDHKA